MNHRMHQIAVIRPPKSRRSVLPDAQEFPPAGIVRHVVDGTTVSDQRMPEHSGFQRIEADDGVGSAGGDLPGREGEVGG
jgi:hypothetical protein